MTPAARIQAAIDIVDRWRSGTDQLDRVLATWGRDNRYAGSGDRRAIADLVYDAARRLRSAGWVAGAGEDATGEDATGRDILLGSLLLDGRDHAALAALFAGQGYGPPALDAAEAARLGRPLEEAPRPVRLDFPDWLAPHFEHLPDAVLAAMRDRAPLFLRANLLRADREAAIAALAEEGIVAEPGPLSPTCLRVIDGGRHVARSGAFAEGLVEVQDAASQAVADFAGAAPGETVLDYCAGAGGKTLALAARMGGRGDLTAHDIEPGRLDRLHGRAGRAGVEVTLRGPGETEDLALSCDLVLVDAPCSGSGTWRRNPDAKWRLTPRALAAHLDVQDAVLARAAAAVRPGGRLVYATCSLIEAENGDRARAFLASHPEFRAGRPPLRLTDPEAGDGFFACEFLRRPD